VSVEGWREVKFQDVTVNLDSKRIPLSSRVRENRKGQFPYYGAQGIIDCIDDYIFEGEYLLIAEDGENLKSKKQNVANLANGKFWVNNHAHIIQNNDLSDLHFLSYVFNNIDITGYITGSAQPKLSQQNLNAIKFLLPPLFEQKVIASTLKTFDDTIELNNQINKKLEEMSQAIFKSWFVDFEPFKDGEFEESELGWIPKGWRVDSIGNCTSIVTRGIAPKYAEISDGHVINQKCIRDGSLNTSLARPHCSVVKEEKKLQFGDVLINSTGIGTLGRVAQVYEQLENYTVDSHVTIVRQNMSNGIGYFGCLLKNMQPKFEHAATGSTGQTELGREDIKQMRILIPSNNIIDEFSKIYNSLSNKIVCCKKENTVLSNIRDTLLPKLMFGDIRVPVEEVEQLV